MSQQNIKLLNKYGDEETFSNVEAVTLRTAEGHNATFYDTSDASVSASTLLAGGVAYGPSGRVVGSVGSYTPSGEVTSPSVTLPTANKYCTANIVVNVPAGGSLPAGTRTLTYSLTAGGTTHAIQYVAPGESTVAPTPPSPPSGKIFVGWTINGEICPFPFTPDGNTELVARFITPADAVVGATGVTHSNGVLTLTDDATALEKYTLDRKGAYVRVVNPLDKLFPFSEISEFTDSYGNVFVKIPKMYVEWVTTTINSETVIDGVRFAKTATPLGAGAFIPSCFRDPDDWNSYFDYVYIGKYEASVASQSTMGTQFASMPGSSVASQTRASFRDNIRNTYNGNY